MTQPPSGPPTLFGDAPLGKSATLTVCVHSRLPGLVLFASLIVIVPEGEAATDASLTPISVSVSAAGVNVDEATGLVVSAVFAVSELRKAFVPVVSTTDQVPVALMLPEAVEISVAASAELTANRTTAEIIRLTQRWPPVINANSTRSHCNMPGLQ